MIKWINKNISTVSIIFLFTALLIVFSVLAFLSDGSYIGGDTYVRYVLARYAFQYPGNFLNHWGKPIYIALASPFAQFGYLGFKFFNIISGLCTGLFAYLICKKLKFDNSWLVLLFVCFSPIYYMLMFTGMTEIFFGFIIMLSIFLVLNEKYIASAIVLSFLPIIRNEGIAIWMLFIFIYVIRKQYKALPFLLSGILLYSIIGWLYYKDFWWLITQNPYKPGSYTYYGHGTWYFYLADLKFTLGIPLAVLFIPGLYAVVDDVFIKNKLKASFVNKDIQIVVLVLAVFLTYFTIHSILWWKGWMAVLGDARFMAAVTPLAAIIGLKGLNALLYYLKYFKIVVVSLSILIGVLVVYTAQFIYPMPVHLQTNDLVVKHTADWIKEHKLNNNKMFYYDPYFPVAIDINPFDNTKAQSFINNREKPEDEIKKGELIIWDAHMSPNEGGLPLNRLTENTNFTMLKVFKPDVPFKVLGGYDYEIYVFQRN